MKPRVFVSHSTAKPSSEGGDSRAREVLASLVQALEGAGFVVQVDYTGLRGGMSWRSVINGWLCTCDAALVVLSERALDSDFIAYEVSVLSHRATVEDAFRLIPIHLVSAESIRGALKLAPAQVAERQGVDARTADPAGEVLGLLAGLSPRIAVPRPVQQLSDLLRKSFTSDLEQAAQTLGLYGDTWHGHRDDLPTKVASKMIACGLDDCVNVLQYVSGAWDARDLEEALQLIASGWVDERAAARIPTAAQAGGALESSAHDPLTAQLYVLRACPYRPRKCWVMVTVDGVVGELSRGAHTTELLRKVRTALGSALKTSDPQLLGKRLKAKRKDGQYVFLAMSRRGMDAQTFASLRGEFPDVTFFLLEGSALASELRMHPADEYLLPELDAREEAQYLAAYREKCDQLLDESGEYGP